MLKIYSRLNKYSQVVKSLNSNCYSTALKPIEKPETDDETDKKIKEYERISKITKRTRTKRPQREPFVKNLFLGKFDTDILTYPELEKQEVENLNKSVQSISTSIKEVQSKSIKAYIKGLGDKNLLGLQLPQIIGGRELNVCESCRFMEKLSDSDLSHTMISNEYLGIQAIQKFGNDKQKQKYLGQLLSGDLVSSFCLLESHVSSHNSLNTKAVFIKETNEWVINGEKIWVLNGNVADVFIILAETGTTIVKGAQQIQISAFIVDRNQQGVKITKYPMTAASLDMANVVFEKVTVSQDNILGPLNEGTSVLQALIPEFRLNSGIPNLTITKNLLNEFTKYSIDNATPHLALYETDEVLSLVGKMAVSIYAMESMIYLTAGLLDHYEKQDCDIEAAIVKTFNAQSAYDCTKLCLNFVGNTALLKDHWCNTAHNKILTNLVLQESADNMKIMIALMGLQHAGMGLQEIVKKLRNPLFHSGFILKRMYTQRRQKQDNPKLNLGLCGYLHPTLTRASEHLEYCVLRLQFATELMLSRHGAEVVNEHTNLKRLAECAMDIYAMTACIGRASRSYCIGLQHSENEVIMADTFCGVAVKRVQDKINKIYSGDVPTHDKDYKQIAQVIFKFKEYCSAHPLTRNF